ncbi:unnamed protein product, partial [Linum tenue]
KEKPALSNSIIIFAHYYSSLKTSLLFSREKEGRKERKRDSVSSRVFFLFNQDPWKEFRHGFPSTSSAQLEEYGQQQLEAHSLSTIGRLLRLSSPVLGSSTPGCTHRP